MLLSVIVPMFNTSKYISSLKKCIDLTTNNNIEFILIDDGSKDDTFDKCKKKFINNVNVKIYRNDNHGVSYTRNYGINIASGKYIMFWDADDLLEKKWDKYVINAIEKNFDSDIIIFSSKLNTCYPEKKELIESMIGISNKYNNNCLAAPWSKVFKKSFISKNNIKFNEKILHGEDLLFNIEAILLSNKCKIVNISFYLYYINMNSATHKFDNRFLDSNQKYIENLEQLLKKYFVNQEQFTFKCICYSFINSLYIFTGKVSKASDFKCILQIIKDFYSRDFYKKNMKKYNIKYAYSLKNKLLYFLIKIKMLYLIEFFLFYFRKKKNKYKEKYILA